MQAPPAPGQYGGPPRKQNNVVLWVILGVFGAGCCGIVGVFAVLGLPVFMQARAAAQTTRCMSNTKELALAVTLYSIDNNDLAPPADRWLDGVKKYASGNDPTFCPSARAQSKEATGYAFNIDLGGKNTNKVEHKETTALIFDTTVQGRNAASGLETLPSPGRHRRGDKQGNNVAYVDASAKFVPSTP